LIKKIIVCLIPLLLLECSSTSKRYSPDDAVILDRTISEIGYVRGYDTDLKMDYIVSNSSSERDLSKKEPQITAILKGYTAEAVMSFFEKIYSLKVETLNMIAKKEKKKKWQEHTYLIKYLYPPLEKYVEFMEKCIIKSNKDYTEKISSSKESIDKKYAKK
jgi:hypothetical protein